MQQELPKFVPEEDPLDPFDRQRYMYNFKQGVVEEQTCLLLGVGGLGCATAFALARLGVKKIVLVDRDTVAVSNLNRQMLFTVAQVGRRKVDAAAESLQSQHVLARGSGGAPCTEIVALHLDVLTEWQRVVSLAQESTVIFNGIDIGGYFDYAVLSLGKTLKVPVVAGSSYSSTWIVEYFTGLPQHDSFSLVNAVGDPDIFDRLAPSLIQSEENLRFLPSDANPDTRSIGSNVVVCVSAGLMTVNAWCQSLMMLREMAAARAPVHSSNSNSSSHSSSSDNSNSNRSGVPDEAIPPNLLPNYSKFDLRQYWQAGDIIGWPHPLSSSSNFS